MMRDINNARKLGLNAGHAKELEGRINMLRRLLKRAKSIRKNPRLPKEIYDYLNEMMTE